LRAAKQETEVASANLQKQKAAFLPKLNLQYAKQEVQGVDGFYTYQAGVSIPFLSGKSYGDARAAKIETQIVNRKANFKKQQFLVQLQQAKRNYESWKDNWQYYQKAALKVAKEQRKGALLAYKEGALDYVAFIQNLEEALRTELDAIEAAKSYLLAYADMKFYLGNDI
ncbi:MAG TPA: CusA/CzcA family heavy metal efflux RND transporter, partial [Zunongwangia profunda]|nr:CusA/CzcA family heavy metal efflux RND transporter [Zunongwangia profunda]